MGNSECKGGRERERRERGTKRRLYLPQVRLVVTRLSDEGAISGLGMRAQADGRLDSR